MSLYELNLLVRDTLETDLPDAYWVEAELSEAREVRGHCYMELVQYDVLSQFSAMASRTPIARASAKCWQSKWAVLRPRFEKVTGQQLHAGMKVLLKVTANFHEAYGFSWIVSDIDPTYTIGDMARKRQEILRQLHEEGIFDLQKELTLSAFAQHIAVISSENAAGYGDFCNQLADNEYGFKFRTRLFPAIMQGEQVEESIITALNKIFDAQEEETFDAVVIIRGGGATADLSGFDTLALAENVAQFPLPVITGIGHDRDESILDMISHTRVKTPTAAAAFLVDHLAATWESLESMRMTIVNLTRQRLTAEKLRLEQLKGNIPSLLTQLTSRAAMDLGQLSMRLQSATRSILTNKRHQLQLLEQRVELSDPSRLLQRGYSMTLKDGRVVSDSRQLKEGDIIETRLAKGTVKSIVSK